MTPYRVQTAALTLALWTSTLAAQTSDSNHSKPPSFERVAPASTQVIASEPAAVSAPLSCDSGGCCERRGRGLYIQGEYLLWWFRSNSLPALVTTGDPNDLQPGALGLPATRVVLGGENIEQDAQSGIRLTVGVPLRSCWALEGTFLYVGESSTRLGVASNGSGTSAVLSRPYFDIVNNIENADPVALPFVQGGAVNVELQSRLWGFEVNGRRTGRNGANGLQFLAGFRYLELEENLTITATTQDIPVGTGNRTVLVDFFGAENRFYGGQVGLAGEWCFGKLSVGAQGKIALGCLEQRQNINGSRVIVDETTGTTTAFAAALLAQPTNTGEFSRNRFAVVPEININLGYQVTERVRATVGYTFLCISDVTRPGEQIDRVINTTQFPPNNLTGAARPTATFRDGDFWTHGLNVGVEFKF